MTDITVYVENVKNPRNECHKRPLVVRLHAPILVSTHHEHQARAFREERVFESQHPLRHMPFFEEAASLAADSPEWRATTAGLVVLRLLDSWLDEGPTAVRGNAWGLRGVQAAIEDVDEGTPIRTLLLRVLDGMREQKPDIHVVVTPLMAYAQALEYDAKWSLAADVYQSVLAHLHPLEDGDASVAAHLRLGSCYRNLNLIEQASAAFGSASEIAVVTGDMVGMLRARIGEAKIAISRGNLPRAEEILDETIVQASTRNFDDVRSRALHDRSTVAQLRGEYELAIRFAYDALRHSQSPTERDRILGDIALAFTELGVYSAARDAYLVLSATAQEQYTRWSATINLIQISSETSAEMLFELYRRQLSAAPLPPYLATVYELQLGTGYQRFGNFAKARAHLERAMALATEHGFNQYLFEAEEALLELETRTPPHRLQREVPLDFEEVASAIRELRVAAGVS